MTRNYGPLLRILLLLTCLSPLRGQSPLPFQKPDPVIRELADAPRPPQGMVEPHGRILLLLQYEPFLQLEDLAQPELRLAGLRLNPRTHNRSRSRYYTGLTLQDLSTGRKIDIRGLPERLRLEDPGFSPDGQRLAFLEPEESGLKLWVVDIPGQTARCLTAPVLSAVLRRPYVWAADSRSLFLRIRPTAGTYASGPSLPEGPAIQESAGVRAPGRTYQDLLRNPDDEARFAFYATHRVGKIDSEGRISEVLPPGIYSDILPSPDGRFLLVTEIRRPFSYQFPLERFPYRTRILDSRGESVALLVEKPLQDRIPIDSDAVESGRRDFAWREDQPATVTWVEALDGGDPAQPATQRDALYQLGSPFAASPALLARTKYRFRRIQWGNGHLAILQDQWWKTRRTSRYQIDPSIPGLDPKLLFERSSEDVYGDPGNFVTRPDEANRMRLAFGDQDRSLYLAGEGCSPEGNRPFLDRYDLQTGRTERLWRAEGRNTYESILRAVDPAAGVMITSVESPTAYPNLYRRSLRGSPALRPLTFFENPFKALSGVKKEIIHYRREDGLALSATLLLPPGYEPARDGRLPLLMEAYPLEYKDAGAAGQLRESPHAFSLPSWGSPVFWVLRGFAVLENAQFPIVGQGSAEPNDTYIEQLVANARAAIDEAVRRGIADRARVACMGHSYGAFMVANLLAHSDLFRAGIARSGAYNRTLTPFGFQGEDRNYWQAPQVYLRMSPFQYADRIKSALLLIHGDADNNPGTFPLQSERLFQAVKGLGGTARLVLLPLESHGYAARENILHMLWEQDQWLEKKVKIP